MVFRNATSFVTSISADGRYVGFYSDATNLVDNDSNGVTDGFVKDMLTGQIVRVTTDSNGSQANGASLLGGMSADGRYVVFESAATNLVSSDTSVLADIFVKDIVTGQTTRVSTNSSGSEANNESHYAYISADGRYVGFFSYASNLVSGDTNGSGDSFVKDLSTGQTVRVTTDSSGNQLNGQSEIRGLSADGRFALFASFATNVTATDTNGAIQDVFVKDLLTGEVRMSNVDNSGNQLASNHSYARAISADGRHVLYHVDNSTGFLRDQAKVGIQEISGMVVSNQASARITVDLTKNYLSEISRYRAGIGASLSRASTFINLLQVQNENYSAAVSQITDADIADEAAQLTRTQILQQSAGSILAQANQQPGLALKLLSGV